MLHARVLAVMVASAAIASCVDPDEAPGLTVSGTVVSPYGGPIAGAQVWIGDRPVATSGPDGTFEVARVRIPYDAVVRASDGGQTYVSIYQGLTERIPFLTVDAPAPRSTAWLAGWLEGFTHQPGDGVVGVACGQRLFSTFGVAADGTFNFGLAWDTGATETATLHALQYTPDAQGLPASYPGKWTAGPSELLDGAIYDFVEFPRDAIVAERVTARYSGLPTGYSAERAVPATGDGRCLLVLPAVQTPPTEFAYLAPWSGPGTFRIAIVAGDGAGARVAAHVQYRLGVSRLEISLPPALVLPSPPPSGALTTATALEASWGWAGSVFVHRLVSAPGAPVVRVVTSAERATLDGLARAGVTLPSGAVYAWTVETLDLAADTYARWRVVASFDEPAAPFQFNVSARSAPRTLVVP